MLRRPKEAGGAWTNFGDCRCAHRPNRRLPKSARTLVAGYITASPFCSRKSEHIPAKLESKSEISNESTRFSIISRAMVRAERHIELWFQDGNFGHLSGGRRPKRRQVRVIGQSSRRKRSSQKLPNYANENCHFIRL